MNIKDLVFRLIKENHFLYLSSIVLDAEAAVWQAVVSEELWILAQATLKVLVLSTDGVQFVQEGLVGDRPWPQALLVQHGQDATLILDIGRKVEILHDWYKTTNHIMKYYYS